MTANSESRCEFAIAVRAITRPAIFPGIRARIRVLYTYTSGEILDVTFRLLPTCSAARNRRMRQARFSERIIAGLYEYTARRHIRTFLLVPCIKRRSSCARVQKPAKSRGGYATAVAFNGEFISRKGTLVARYNCCRNGICK